MDFADSEWDQLDADDHLITHDLPPAEVDMAIAIKTQHPCISALDCLCRSATRSLPDAVLITGDWNLRRIAVQNHLCVHGVLWVYDQIQKTHTCSHIRLRTALEYWQRYPYVYLPESETAVRLKALR